MKVSTLKFLALIISCLPSICLAQIPVVESFSPSTAWPGEVIHIVGTDLLTVTAVSVGSTPGLIIHQEDGLLSFVVASGSQTDVLNLTYDMGQVSSASNLTITELDVYATPSHMHTKIDASGGSKVCISADGSTMVSSGSGVVRVYNRSGNSITQETSWNLPGQHGYAIALSSSGNTLAVGAPADNGGRGRLFIYERTNGVWQEQYAVTPGGISPGTYGTNFAMAVAISADGNTVAAGLPYDDAEGDGGAFVFTRTDNGTDNVWSQVGSELEGANVTGTNPSRQGVATLLLNDNGTILMIFGNDVLSNGAVWVFHNVAGIWSEFQKIIPPMDNTINHFAQPLSSGSLSTDGRFLFVGAVSSFVPPSSFSGEGAVIVYEWNGLQYVYRQRLNSSQAFDWVQFGRTVSTNADGSLVAIGECDAMHPQGRVRVFFNEDVNAGNWLEQPLPLRYDPVMYDTLDFNPQDGQGRSVALAQNSRWLIMGSPEAQSGFYVYDGSPAPVIYSFAPEAGTEGTGVIITGENFQTAFAVSFIGITATSVARISPTTVRAIVSEGVNAQGNVVLRTKGGEVSIQGFMYVEPPQISSFLPASGLPGTIITIDGLNLQATQSVMIGGEPAESFQVVNDNQVLATVASGASGLISLSTAFGETNSALNFNFITPQPAILSFDPPSAGPLTTVVIEGENLFWVDAVHFGSTPALNFTLNAEGNIEAVVGYGSSGDVSIESEGGIHAVAGFTYLPPAPEAYAFSPASGPVGTAVIILGDNLEALTDIDFNGNAAVIIGRDQSRAMALVMPGTTSGPVSVSAGDVQADLPGEFELTTMLLPNEQQGNINTGVSPLASTDAASTIVASADGSVVAIGAPGDDTYGLDAGSIRIFSRAADGTNQEIQNLHVATLGASLGSQLTMSADGSMLVANTDIADLDTLHVFLRGPEGQWHLDYKIPGLREIYSLSLSGDKSKLAVGYRAPFGGAMPFSIYELGSGGVISHQEIVLAGELFLNLNRYGKVAFSLDGNTLAIGSYNENLRGAFWIYRFDEVTQTWIGSPKLIPNDAIHDNPGDANGARIGWDVAVSANGSRVLVSGFLEGNTRVNFLPVNRGAIWSYSFNGVSWVQDGPKVKPQGGVGEIRFGSSIGLSADGNTATVAGYIDNGNIGAIWLLQWNGAAWTQVGNKLVPEGPGTLRTSSLNLTPDARNLFVGSRNNGFYVFQNALTPDYINPLLALNLATVSINSSPIVLNAISDSPGNITYHIVPGGTAGATLEGNNLTLLSTGNVIIRAVQEAIDNYLAGEVYDTLVVTTLLEQTIDFQTLAPLLVTTVSEDLRATASSGLPVSYISSNPAVATVSGNLILVVGWGETVITASQEGNGMYLPAPSVEQVLTINRVLQAVTFDALEDKIFNVDFFFELLATATSGLDITYTSSDPDVARIEGNVVSVTGPGTSIITATQSGNEIYAPAVAQQLLTVLPQPDSTSGMRKGANEKSEPQVSNSLEEIEKTVYPNPTDGFVYVRTSTESIRQIILFNSRGQNLGTQKFEYVDATTIKLNLSMLPAGIYFMKASDDIRMYTFKVSKR